MIGFKPVPYRNDESGREYKIVHATRENMTDLMEWAEENGCDVVGHPSTNFILYGTGADSSRYSVDVEPGVYLCLDSDGYFVGFDSDTTDLDEDWTCLSS